MFLRKIDRSWDRLETDLESREIGTAWGATYGRDEKYMAWYTAWCRDSRHESRWDRGSMANCGETVFRPFWPGESLSCLQGAALSFWPLRRCSTDRFVAATPLKSWRDEVWLFHPRGRRPLLSCFFVFFRTFGKTGGVPCRCRAVPWKLTSWSNPLVPPFMGSKYGSIRNVLPSLLPAFQWLGPWVHIGVCIIWQVRKVLKIHHENHEKTCMDHPMDHPNLCICMPIYAMQCCRDEEDWDCWCTWHSSHSRQPLIFHIIDILDASLTMDWTNMKSAKMWFIKTSQKGLFKTFLKHSQNIPNTFPFPKA